MKGLSLNLGMTQLTKSAAALTEALRFGRKPEAEACFAQVKLDYNMTAEAIRPAGRGRVEEKQGMAPSGTVPLLFCDLCCSADAVLQFTAYVCGS